MAPRPVRPGRPLATGPEHPVLARAASAPGADLVVAFPVQQISGLAIALLGGAFGLGLGFAGAQRDYVGQVAAALKARGVRCFYDADEQVRLWGTHLAEELPLIYARESAVVVVFVSADYARQPWTRLERRAALARAVAEAGVYVLPARFDDSELPGLLPDVAYIDLRRYTPREFADLVVAKLAYLTISPSPPPGEASRGPAGGMRVSGEEVPPGKFSPGQHGFFSRLRDAFNAR